MFTKINGVRFDGLHSYYDLGMWLAMRPDMGVPKPKTNTVEVPGMDGILDLTEANAGEVKFNNRTIILNFAAMVDIDKQGEFKARIANALHGKTIDQIIFDEDPEWYWSGRASVSFTKISPWKLWVVVTVNAAPYAMKIDETIVDLTSGFAESQDITVAAEDVSKQSWNTDLRFGTKEFPDGLGPAGLGDLYTLKWPSNAVHLGSRWSIQVVDSEGHVYNSGALTTPISDCEKTISVSALTEADVVISKVYRLLVQNLGQCELHSDKIGQRSRIWNERKTVVPNIIWQTEGNPGGEEDLMTLDIIVNGQERTINNKQTQYENILLKEGFNDIIIPLDYISMDTVSLTISFREGKL